MDQVDTNYDAYRRIRHEYEPQHNGKTALMHNGEVIGLYEEAVDAYDTGVERYGLGSFSTQLIGARPVGLGLLTLNLT